MDLMQFRRRDQVRAAMFGTSCSGVRRRRVTSLVSDRQRMGLLCVCAVLDDFRKDAERPRILGVTPGARGR